MKCWFERICGFAETYLADLLILEIWLGNKFLHLWGTTDVSAGQVNKQKCRNLVLWFQEISYLSFLLSGKFPRCSQDSFLELPKIEIGFLLHKLCRLTWKFNSILLR